MDPSNTSHEPMNPVLGYLLGVVTTAIGAIVKMFFDVRDIKSRLAHLETRSETHDENLANINQNLAEIRVSVGYLVKSTDAIQDRMNKR